MTKRIALFLSLIVWGAASAYLSQKEIAANLWHTRWIQGAVRDLGTVVLPTPEQDTWKGIQMGVGSATFLSFVLWLNLRSMVPIDEKRSIGKAVLDEAVETVKDGLPLTPELEKKARGGFWARFERILGR